MKSIKNIILAASIAAMCLGVCGCQKNSTVDQVYIPDDNFKAALLKSTINGNPITKSEVSDPPVDQNGDGQISKEEAAAVVKINVENQGIKSFVGVECFVNVTEIDCAKNDLENLDLTANAKLKVLVCSDNDLVSVDLSASAALEELYCDDNEIKSLNLNACAGLKVLVCNDNKLTKLDISANAGIQELHCQGNMLLSLDATKLSLNVQLVCGDQVDENGKPVTLSLILNLNFKTFWEALVKLFTQNVHVSVTYR